MVRGTWMLKPWLFVKRLTSCSFRQTNLINISFLNFDWWKNLIIKFQVMFGQCKKLKFDFEVTNCRNLLLKDLFNIILCNHLWGMVIDCRKRANSFVKDVRLRDLQWFIENLIWFYRLTWVSDWRKYAK